MSGSALASIKQNCKACNKCFTGSPQDATPVQGLHSNAHGAKTGAKRKSTVKGGREETVGFKERGGRKGKSVSKNNGKMLRLVDPNHLEESPFPQSLKTSKIFQDVTYQ